MPKILSIQELRLLTSSFRTVKIMRELDFMKIPYKTTSCGKVVVFENDLIGRTTTTNSNPQPMPNLTKWNPNL